jgi:hypothetical protein
MYAAEHEQWGIESIGCGHVINFGVHLKITHNDIAPTWTAARYGSSRQPWIPFPQGEHGTSTKKMLEDTHG